MYIYFVLYFISQIIPTLAIESSLTYLFKFNKLREDKFRGKSKQGPYSIH